MRRLGAAICLLPGAAFACALPPSVVMTLPTGRYMAGAAATVAATAIIGAAAHRLPPMRARMLWERPVFIPEAVSSYLAFLLFLGLIGVGFLGSRDPMHNLLTLIFWTGVWVALPLASLMFGNLWRAVNPWTAMVRMARVLLGRTGGIGLARLGHGPAVVGYLGFIWFEIISLAPDDPLVLAKVALVYWLVIFVLAVAEGEAWLQRGEFLTVYLGLIAKIAPFWLEIDGRRARLFAGWPGTQVLRMPPLDPSAVIFITLVLAGLTFDGLHETFFWLGLTGQNPLEFVGRSAVMGVNTLGLLAVWAMTAAAVLGVFALARRLARHRGPFWTEAGPMMLSFLAIAAGYHGAHYLVTLLTSGQYTLAALNDPLFRGDAWLGLPPFYVSFGFLADRWLMTLIWNIQFAAILGAHVLAVVLGLHLSMRAGSVRLLAHLPMTALMVGYTVLGLWLLAAPIGA
ncbi:MAG: hypothetical protein Q8P60_09630 [Pseudorhodobacter sp.]|nr:hypothetical protein [Pseudorhodobacter sp.]